MNSRKVCGLCKKTLTDRDYRVNNYKVIEKEVEGEDPLLEHVHADCHDLDLIYNRRRRVNYEEEF